MALKKYFNPRRLISIMVDEQKLKELTFKANQFGLTLTEFIDLLINQELKIRNAFEIAKEKSRIILNVEVKKWFNESEFVKDNIKYLHKETKMDLIKIKAKLLVEEYSRECLIKCLKPDVNALIQFQALILNVSKDKDEQIINSRL